MSRVRPFIVRMDANPQFLADRPDVARRFIREDIQRKAAEPLRGPRGGRYEAVNQPYDYQERPGLDYALRPCVVFTARVTGRYVRPKR